MGLNDLELSSNIIAALYPSSLITLDPGDNMLPPVSNPLIAKPIEEQKTNVETHWKYLGNNKKNVLVVVNYDNAVHLPDEELAFLTNMLAACKLNLGDVVIVNNSNYKESTYKDFITQFKSKIVFLFGVEPQAFGLPVSFPPYQVQSFANCTFLFTPTLEEQREDTLLKSKLWVSLRTIFNI